MNPASSLAPAIVSGYYFDLWLYLTAPFIGTTIVALLLRNKILVQFGKFIIFVLIFPFKELAM
jgi:hypothetical protein